MEQQDQDARVYRALTLNGEPLVRVNIEAPADVVAFALERLTRMQVEGRDRALHRIHNRNHYRRKEAGLGILPVPADIEAAEWLLRKHGALKPSEPSDRRSVGEAFGRVIAGWIESEASETPRSKSLYPGVRTTSGRG